MKKVSLIKGYPDYRIYSNGIIESRKSGRWKQKAFSEDRDGYLLVSLCHNGICKTHKVHRLVAIEFIKKIKNKTLINHKDGVKSNNNYTNLEWCTQSENHIHAYRVLGKKSARGMKGKIGYWKNKLNISPLCKSVIQMSMDGVIVNEWPSINETGRSGFNFSKVAQVCRGERNHHKNYKWKFK